MEATRQRQERLKAALAWVIERGPGYANQFAQDAPLDEIAEICACLLEIEEPSRESLAALQYYQSRLFELRDALPERGDHDPLDDDAPPHEEYLNRFGDVLIALGGVIDGFPRDEREAARPTTDVPPIEREEWTEVVARIETNVSRLTDALEHLKRTIQAGSELPSADIENDLVVLTNLLEGPQIDLNWVSVIRKGLVKSLKVLRSALTGYGEVHRSWHRIIEKALQEGDSLLKKLIDFLTEIPGSDLQDPFLFEPETVALERGIFTMGSADGHYNEKPPHEVTIGHRLAVGRYPVTFEEYDAFADATEHARPEDRGWGRDRRPVINVSWDDAKAYCAWLAERTGRPYRLLSEAEWEYACRAGRETAYSTGEEVGEGDANFGGNVGKTTEVGSYPANPWRLHDLHGTVWEWVEDSWHDGYDGAPGDGGAWTEGDNAVRVLRGGSWSLHPVHLRAAYRLRAHPGLRNDIVGFRFARTLP